MSQVVLEQDPAPVVQERQSVQHIPLHLWLTLPIAIGTVLVALAGALYPATIYSNSLSLAAQGQGQDVVTVIVVVPALLLSAWAVWRGVLAAKLIWFGALFYLAYTYAIGAFQVQFNALFLLYVIILGSASYALVLGFNTIEPQRVRFTENAPVRVLSVIALVIAAAFYFIWLSDVVPALLNGTLPVSVVTDNIPTPSVAVLDMAFFLPLLIAGAVLLWRRQPSGYFVIGTAFSFGILIGIAVMAMIVATAQWGLVDSVSQVAIFAVIVSFFSGSLIALIRSVKTS